MTMTKLAYKWMVEFKDILKKEGQQPNSLMGGGSNIKSSPRGKDNEQSRLQVTDQMQVIPKWEWKILETSYL